MVRVRSTLDVLNRLLLVVFRIEQDVDARELCNGLEQHARLRFIIFRSIGSLFSGCSSGTGSSESVRSCVSLASQFGRASASSCPRATRRRGVRRRSCSRSIISCVRRISCAAISDDGIDAHRPSGTPPEPRRACPRCAASGRSSRACAPGLKPHAADFQHIGRIATGPAPSPARPVRAHDRSCLSAPPPGLVAQFVALPRLGHQRRRRQNQQADQQRLQLI